MANKQLREIIKEVINEAREPKTLDLFMKIVKSSPEIEKTIKVGYIAGGIQGFVRTKDGNAYEITIKPGSQVKGKY